MEDGAMSGDKDLKVQQIANKLEDYGKPALEMMRVTTMELPSLYAIFFACCSMLYVILHNLSIRMFSVLGLILLWLDYYLSENNVKIPELTKEEKEELGYLCSKLITLETKVEAVISQFRTMREQDPDYVFRQMCTFLGLAIAVSWCVDNLLLLYLTALSLLMLACVHLNPSPVSVQNQM